MNQIESKSIHLIEGKKEKNKVEKKLWKIKLYKLFRKITYTYYVYLLVFRDIITYKYLCEYFF